MIVCGVSGSHTSNLSKVWGCQAGWGEVDFWMGNQVYILSLCTLGLTRVCQEKQQDS